VLWRVARGLCGPDHLTSTFCWFSLRLHACRGCVQVGYLVAGIKTVEDARVGDTITLENGKGRAAEALPGYAEAKPMVWCGIFPTDAGQYAPPLPTVAPTHVPTVHSLS